MYTGVYIYNTDDLFLNCSTFNSGYYVAIIMDFCSFLATSDALALFGREDTPISPSLEWEDPFFLALPTRLRDTLFC